MREGDWKLIANGKASPEKVELFNLATDPQEKKDLAGSMPDRLAALKDRMAVIAKADRDAEVKEAGWGRPE